MGPCCEYCYTQYINKDGTIDENFVHKEFGVEAQVVVTERYISETIEKPFLFFFKKTVKAHRLSHTLKHVRPLGKPLVALCNCSCHEKGSSTFH